MATSAREVQNSVSQNFLLHRPLLTLDTLLSPSSVIKKTQGSNFKEGI